MENEDNKTYVGIYKPDNGEVDKDHPDFVRQRVPNFVTTDKLYFNYAKTLEDLKNIWWLQSWMEGFPDDKFKGFAVAKISLSSKRYHLMAMMEKNYWAVAVLNKDFGLPNWKDFDSCKNTNTA